MLIIVAAQLQVVPKKLTWEEKIDRYGELDEAIQRFAPTVDEHAQLKAEIQEFYEAYPADKAALAKGAAFTLQIGERKNERTITDQKKAFQLLRAAAGSLDGAIALITIPLTAVVDKYLNDSQQRMVIKKERTGHRSVKAVRNAE